MRKAIREGWQAHELQVWSSKAEQRKSGFRRTHPLALAYRAGGTRVSLDLVVLSTVIFHNVFTLAEQEIDHVIAVKRGGQTVPENLALCCTVCNRFKGSDIASLDSETGQLTPLFHPRHERWDDHHEFRNGEILGLTATGRVTIRLLQMNRPTRIKERQLLQR